MKWILFLILGFILVYEISCGVKSKPLAPLKEPWISSGEVEKDREKRFKSKKQPSAPTEEKKEL